VKLFRLSADDCYLRIEQSGNEPKLRPLGNCLFIGGLGFCIVSLLVFGIWAFAAASLSRTIGEGGFYAVCAVAFIGLSGALFDRLVIGPGSLAKFYALFTSAFAIYSVLWCLAWFLLRKDSAEWYGFLTGARPAGLVGAFLGTFAMAACLSAGFSNWKSFWKNAFILFGTHTAGYFLGDFLFTWLRGEFAEQALEGIISRPVRMVIAKLAWGFGYGIGFGLGIGQNLHELQAPLRARLATAKQPKE
jgi:hypothetical protein